MWQDGGQRGVNLESNLPLAPTRCRRHSCQLDTTLCTLLPDRRIYTIFSALSLLPPSPSPRLSLRTAEVLRWQRWTRLKSSTMESTRPPTRPRRDATPQQRIGWSGTRDSNQPLPSFFAATRCENTCHHLELLPVTFSPSSMHASWTTWGGCRARAQVDGRCTWLLPSLPNLDGRWRVSSSASNTRRL